MATRSSDDERKQLIENNRKKCHSLIRSVFSTAAGYKVDYKSKSGHLLVKARFWTVEFEFPTMSNGTWFANLNFQPEGSLSSKKARGWMLEAKSPDKLEENLREKLREVGQATLDLIYHPSAPPPPPPTLGGELAARSAKVLDALQAKPDLLWQVARDIATKRLASPWSQKIEVKEEDGWVKVEDPDGTISEQRQKVTRDIVSYRRQALGWEGLGTVATVTEEGSRWLVHWVGCKASVPNPNLDTAMEFADRMLKQEGWNLL